MQVTDLQTSEYHTYYANYINKVPKDVTLIEGFKIGSQQVLEFFTAIPNAKLNYSYAEGKWSIKEVFQHIIDTERVFIYRCFRIARQDKTQLAGFEQDDYIAPSKARLKSMYDLLEEYKAVRQNSIVFLKSVIEEDLKYVGHASGSQLSARAAAFMVLGHEIHHVDVIKQKYLV